MIDKHTHRAPYAPVIADALRIMSTTAITDEGST